MEPRILIVDDEKLVLSYLATVLAEDGYSIRTADSGAMALRLIETNDFDLVLCDMRMPEVSGLEVLEEVRRRKPDTPFILVTAYGSLRSAVKALRLGACDYLLKPFDEEELRHHVRSAIEQRLLRKEYEARTRELESFVFAISHDLAGHLTALRGFARRLRQKCLPEFGTEVCGWLDRVDSSAERIETLVNAIAEFAKAGAEPEKTELVDLNHLIQNVLQDFESFIEEKHAQVRVASDLPVIETEWIDAYRVFQNLVGNAIKFARDDTEPVIEVGVSEQGQFYEFYVKDNGIGVRKEDREKIFELFGRGGGADRAPGMGLGLAIVKRIVNKVGGKVWVESEETFGSTFYFTFPKRVTSREEHVEERVSSRQ